MAEPDPTDLRYYAGANWLDLVATVGSAYSEAPVERLFGTARLAEWLAAEGLAPRTPPDEDDLALARTLREALRRLAWNVIDGTAPARADRELVNEIAAGPPARFATSGERLVALPPEHARDALAPVARRAIEDLTGPAAGHLGYCGGETCRLLYLDPTGRRRWCAPGSCGNRARVRAYRARRAT